MMGMSRKKAPLKIIAWFTWDARTSRHLRPVSLVLLGSPPHLVDPYLIIIINQFQNSTTIFPPSYGLLYILLNSKGRVHLVKRFFHPLWETCRLCSWFAWLTLIHFDYWLIPGRFRLMITVPEVDPSPIFVIITVIYPESPQTSLKRRLL